jgi:uracil DNA glycosylase
MDSIETKLGTEADGIVPVRDSIFESFYDLHPEDVRVIAIGPGPIPVSTAASGYALMDTSATKWTEKLPVAVQRLFDALKAQAQNDGNTTYSVSAGWGQLSVKSWFEYTKKRGVLWLNSCLTRSIHTSRSGGDEVRERAYWLPVVLRVIRYLMEIRASGDAGIVFALFGAEGSPRYDDITTAISKYYSRFSSKLLVRTYKAPDPSEASFKMDEDSNPFAEINASLMETNNQPIEWFPPKPGQPAASSSSVSVVAPPKPTAPAPKASSIFDDDADDSPMKPTLQKKRTAAEMSKPSNASQPKSDGPFPRISALLVSLFKPAAQLML